MIAYLRHSFAEQAHHDATSRLIVDSHVKKHLVSDLRSKKYTQARWFAISTSTLNLCFKCQV
jgi:hypothetical protein